MSSLQNPAGKQPRADRAEPIDFKSGDGLGWKIIDATTALLSLCSSNVVDLLDPRRDYCRRGRSVRDGPLFNDLKTGLVEYLLYPRANEIPLHARYGDDAVFPEEPQCASSDAGWCRRHSKYKVSLMFKKCDGCEVG